jgi:uncharacterized protein YcgI (DUF1989 family)
MDKCPICNIYFKKYDVPYNNCICTTCLLCYQKKTHKKNGLAICFRNTHSFRGFKAVIEGRDSADFVNVFYMNNIRCIAFEGENGTIIYTTAKSESKRLHL